DQAKWVATGDARAGRTEGGGAAVRAAGSARQGVADFGEETLAQGGQTGADAEGDVDRGGGGERRAGQVGDIGATAARTAGTGALAAPGAAAQVERDLGSRLPLRARPESCGAVLGILRHEIGDILSKGPNRVNA